jgi:hypothetical protein
MKQLIKIILPLLLVALGVSSCLKEGRMNVDTTNTAANVVTLQFIENGSGTTINSGMNYFAGGALTYPGDHEKDTATFNVAIGGPVLGKDVTVTVGIDPNKVMDNFAGDSIAYEIMPDSLFQVLGTTATIKAGEATAPLQIVFFPSKIDITKSYMLPIVITDAAGQTISGNYSTLYLHVIGNPLAGGYAWDYIRYNDPNKVGASSGWTDDVTTFSPENPTSVKVPTGYYVQPNYQITFKNANGVLSDFKAVIHPAEIKAAFTDNGINVTMSPVITVSADYKTIEINYVVFNGAAFRNITDIFRKL